MNSLPVTSINLASEPFRRERAQTAAWALACAGLLLLLLLLTSVIWRERLRAADLRRGIENQRAELARLNQEGAKFSSFLARPANADVFARNVFLNEVISRRAVSWTRVFRDLEQLLPSNVRLIGIRLPQVPADETHGLSAGMNRVELDMLVGSEHPEALIELMKKLEASPLFGPTKVLGQTPPNQNDPLYKFRVTVPYAQKL